MEKQKACPACGALLQTDAKKCPACGLEGLDRKFLSRAAYERWVREVLEPHRERLVSRVFAGHGYGLILTPQGKLYGIGSNRAGQILEGGEDWYLQPVLMAENVISAAAGRESIYVTRDGEVHLRGRSEMAERFTGCTGAREVYAYHEPQIFLIRKTDGRLLAFGENDVDGEDECLIEKPREQVWARFEEMSCLNLSGYFMEPWTHGYHQRWKENGGEKQKAELKTEIQKREEYRTAVERFGGRNVSVRLTPVKQESLSDDPCCIFYSDYFNGSINIFPESELEKQLRKRHPYPLLTYGDPFYGQRDAYYRMDDLKRVTYLPEILVHNRVLYTPADYPADPRFTETPHRLGSFPVTGEDLEGFGFPVPPSGCKLVMDETHCLQQQEDGTVADREGKTVVQEPVADLSMSSDWILLSCRNGDLLWCAGWDMLQKYGLDRCRLPEEA